MNKKLSQRGKLFIPMIFKGEIEAYIWKRIQYSDVVSMERPENETSTQE